VADCDLLQPLPLQPADFEAARRKLSGGFNELVSKPIPVESLSSCSAGDGKVLEQVVERVMKEINLSLVRGPVGADSGEVMLAGSLRKATGAVEERALVTITLER
jgi:hypothetical protein